MNDCYESRQLQAYKLRIIAHQHQYLLLCVPWVNLHNDYDDFTIVFQISRWS